MMKTNPFKVGDRVKVYDLVIGTMKGTVTEVNGDIVEVTSKKYIDKFHFRQCVKLYKVDRGPFKVGTRVRVYGTTERLESDYQNGSPYCFRRGDLGTVSSAFPDAEPYYEVTVDLDKGGYLVVHSIQLEIVKDGEDS